MRRTSLVLPVLLFAAACGNSAPASTRPSDFRDAPSSALEQLSESGGIDIPSPKAAEAVPWGASSDTSGQVKPQAVRPAMSPENQVAGGGRTREWLIMVYINGRNNLSKYMLQNIRDMEAAGSSKNVTVVVELGRYDDLPRSEITAAFHQDGYNNAKANGYCSSASRNNTVRYYIEAGKAIPLGTLCNSDMGDPKELTDFAVWANKTFPARRHMLIVSSHGGGYGGISPDDISENSLSLKDLSGALGGISSAYGKKLDIYASDACLMQMAEVIYDLRRYVNVVVGSEENIPGSGFPYTAMLRKFSSAPGANTETLAAMLVRDYAALYARQGGSYGTTISAVRASRMEEFANLMSGWVDQALRSKAADKDLDNAIAQTVRYHESEEDDRLTINSRDIANFLSNLNEALPQGAALRRTGENLTGFIRRELVIESATTGNTAVGEKSTGLAIYMPRKRDFQGSYLGSNGFSSRTRWHEFIGSVCAPSGRSPYQ